MNEQDVVSYVVNRQWTVDQKADRKRYLYRLAQQSKKDPDIASKIGGMLIYNQLIEQFMTDIVKMSIQYIKAEIWPVVVEMDIDIDKATFGVHPQDMLALLSQIGSSPITEIELVGLVSNICVISNLCVFQGAFPLAQMVVDPQLIASFDPSTHEAVLAVMRGLQVRLEGV